MHFVALVTCQDPKEVEKRGESLESGPRSFSIEDAYDWLASNESIKPTVQGEEYRPSYKDWARPSSMGELERQTFNKHEMTEMTRASYVRNKGSQGSSRRDDADDLENATTLTNVSTRTSDFTVIENVLHSKGASSETKD
jgi:hypothetical protein